MNRVVPLLSVLCVVACTQDFGAFGFEAVGDGGRSEVVSEAHGDEDEAPADAGPTLGGGAGAAAGDAAGGAAGGTSRDAGGAGGAGNPTPTADGGVEDAAIDAGGEPAADASDPAADAGEEAVRTCAAAWTAAAPGSESCGNCACDACTAIVTSCLTQGSATEQSLCQSVLACVIEFDCGADCYCQTPQCAAPQLTGDGPCAVQMNAAAGGMRDEVRVILTADDPNEPLVRAMQAAECLLGERSLGPCEGACL